MMYSTIQKWGNSQAVRIPKAIVDKLELKENEPVEIIPGDDAIIIRKTRKHRTFAERMEGYDADYRFTEMESGSPVGREVF